MLVPYLCLIGAHWCLANACLARLATRSSPLPERLNSIAIFGIFRFHPKHLADGIGYNPMDQSAIRYLPPLTHGFGIEAEGMQAVWRDFVKTPSTFSVAMVDGGESKFEMGRAESDQCGCGSRFLQ